MITQNIMKWIDNMKTKNLQREIESRVQKWQKVEVQDTTVPPWCVYNEKIDIIMLIRVSALPGWTSALDCTRACFKSSAAQRKGTSGLGVCRSA